MSGGTMISLACDEIVIEDHAALGPVDPQLGQYPAASLIEVSKLPGQHDDQTLLMADVGRKAIYQTEDFTRRMLERHMTPAQARDVAHLLATGVFTHDHPLQAPELIELGLPVKVGVPTEERELMQLYPQPRGRTPAVEYVPGPQRDPSPQPALPRRRAVPRTRTSRG
jgi:ClpP class serine protease